MDLLLCLSMVFLTLAVASSSYSSSGSSVLYAYGPSAGDRTSYVNDDGNSGRVNLQCGYRFFGSSYRSLYVNTNGHVSFNQPVWTFTPWSWYNFHMVAPYWADINLHLGGKLYYRESTEKSLLDQAEKDVRGITCDGNFHAKCVFVATWADVYFYGAYYAFPTNKFQLVMVTDDHKTYALFNYDRITWTTGRASRGNRYGLDGVLAKAGFAANGMTYDLPTSGTIQVLDLDITTNIGKKGRYAFKIDTTPTKPTRTGGSCIRNCEGLLDGDYQSCCGCDHYVSCVGDGTQTYYNRPCAPSTPPLQWDDNIKQCLWSSTTCTVEE